VKTSERCMGQEAKRYHTRSSAVAVIADRIGELSNRGRLQV